MDTKHVEEPLLSTDSRQTGNGNTVQISHQTTPSSTLNRNVKFSSSLEEYQSESQSQKNAIDQPICILDSTSPLSKVLMIMPLVLVATGLSLQTVVAYSSYNDLDPNDDRVTITGKLIFSVSAIIIAIFSILLVTPDPLYLSGFLIIFTNIAVPFSWLFSGLSSLGLIIIFAIYKTIRHNLKAYKSLVNPLKYKTKSF